MKFNCHGSTNFLEQPGAGRRWQRGRRAHRRGARGRRGRVVQQHCLREATARGRRRRAIPVNLQTASYTLQTSFEHLNDIILGAISTYGDCRAAAILNALLGASLCSGVMEELASCDAPMDIPFA